MRASLIITTSAVSLLAMSNVAVTAQHGQRPYLRDADEIARVLADHVPVERAADLADAVARAARAAAPGDRVLLSPACASFDMFRDYVHRGEYFESLVREMAP